MIEQELRERLGTVAVPPTSLRVDGLVEAGRRRVRRRQALRAGCGAALGVAVLAGVPALLSGPARQQSPAAPPAAVRCAGSTLPLPAGVTRAIAVTVDPSGRHIAGNALGGSRPLLWTDGRPQVLPTSKKAMVTAAVNASGTVVAAGGDGDPWDTVVRYTAGVPAQLRLPAGAWQVHPGPAINARGDVLATASSATAPSVALLWPAGSTTPTRLRLPAGTDVRGLTDDGLIVSGERVWDRNGSEAGARPRVPAGQTLWISTVRGDHATGALQPSGDVARWNVRTGEVTRMPFDGLPRNANARGWTVVDGGIRRDGPPVELATAGGTTGEATDVSDNGVVVGGHVDAGIPMRWTCGAG